jgi:two-component system sensor histidine kinase UhpB
MSSLRRRLVLIPASLLLLGFAAALISALALGRSRVQAEIASGMELASLLLDAERGAYLHLPPAMGALDRLVFRLSRLRHVDLAVLPPPESFAFGFLFRIEADRPAVPLWFVRLLAPPPAMRLVALGEGEGAVRLLLLTNPYDEIAELWAELRSLALLFVALGVLIVLLLIGAAKVALRPLAGLGAALAALGEEDGSVPLTPVRVRELAPIWSRFTALAERLARLREDNHRLIGELIAVQEEERKELAAELHDAVGPELFAIRAEAEALRRRASEGGLEREAVAEHAAAIAHFAGAIQGVTARLLERLRPLVLTELGPWAALEQLCSDWQDRCPDLLITLEAGAGAEEALGRLDESAALALYRGLQECLANVYRHARGARRVSVRLERAGERLLLSVADDGPGFGPEARWGHGLLGLAERLRAAGGRLATGNADGGGAVIRLTVPLRAAKSGPCPVPSS